MNRFARCIVIFAPFLCQLPAAVAQTEVIDFFEWSKSSGGNGHFYGHARVRVSDAPFTRTRDAANSLGGHLTTISNSAENEFVRATIGGGLGLYHEAGGSWQNVTGEPVTFFNWSANQPDNGTQFAFAAYCCPPASTWSDYTDAEIGNPLDPWTGFALEWDADCNGDGKVDFGQIQRGELVDLNQNGVPDGCEISFNSILPPSVPSQGGTTVTIRGQNFPEAPTVLIGDVAATGVVRISPTQITAISPALRPGMASITVGGFTLVDAIYIRPDCGSDLDQNGSVDGGDMAILLLDWGPCYAGVQGQDPPALLTEESATPAQRQP